MTGSDFLHHHLPVRPLRSCKPPGRRPTPSFMPSSVGPRDLDDLRRRVAGLPAQGHAPVPTKHAPRCSPPIHSPPPLPVTTPLPPWGQPAWCFFSPRKMHERSCRRWGGGRINALFIWKDLGEILIHLALLSH
ncbi:hypothetical protein PVAP13_9KG117800 [Panicum virgatum]|uniref:Uncharacterized protein n=1 Tax=Panicum virgatum TaxID=38727 RepID=A0A8T0NHI3_PANVG|nr:hypothetical protein PVAP13_9KG117800 [Panicum virgatum]KAG2547709.1 hypothetical protein PVAP13_9KG117800 [Panicum virgatum]